MNIILQLASILITIRYFWDLSGCVFWTKIVSNEINVYL